MNDPEAFSVIGVVPMATEKPCFCTPVFRDADGSLYAQSSSNGQTIEEFVALGEFPSRSIVKLRSNREFHIGDELLSGFRTHTRQHVVDSRADIYRLIIKDFHIYADDRELIIFILDKVLDSEQIFEVFSAGNSEYLLNVLMRLIISDQATWLGGRVRTVKMDYDKLVQIKVPNSSVSWEKVLKESGRKSLEWKNSAGKALEENLINIPSASVRNWILKINDDKELLTSKTSIANILNMLKAGR